MPAGMIKVMVSDAQSCKRREFRMAPKGEESGTANSGVKTKKSWLVQGVYTSELTGNQHYTYLTIAYGSSGGGWGRSTKEEDEQINKLAAEKIARATWELKFPRETPKPTGQTIKNEGAYSLKKKK